jgi:hypothetical protein
MSASGSNHSGGLVPDPGSTAGTSKYLREDGTWQIPSTNTYSEIGYTTTAVNGSGALTLAGTDPIYVVTVSANISSVELTANPSAGHSCHIFFVTDSSDSTDRTVAIRHDSTNRVCPNAEDISFTVPKNAGGYVEVDFLNANNKVYVRGV